MSRTRNFEPVKVNDKIAEILNKDSNNFRTIRELNLFALSILDLTTLEGSDSNTTIDSLCSKAQSFSKQGLPDVAAVCVYPVFVRYAKSLLANTPIKVASVAGAFPAGQSPIHIKLSEIKYAIEEGADEIDMVISRGKFLQGDYIEVYDEIHAIKELCGDVHLKVILETGELNDLNSIYDASMLALKAGADFIKTSTGKVSPAATPEASYVMLQAIRDYYQTTGRKAGFKPAGGIATPDQAMVYIQLVEAILGTDWLNNKLFRIGASRLATNLASMLAS